MPARLQKIIQTKDSQDLKGMNKIINSHVYFTMKKDAGVACTVLKKLELNINVDFRCI